MNIKKVIMQSFVKLLMLQYMQCGGDKSLEQSQIQSGQVSIFSTLLELYHNPNALEEARNRIEKLEKETKELKAKVDRLNKDLDDSREAKVFCRPISSGSNKALRSL